MRSIEIPRGTPKPRDTRLTQCLDDGYGPAELRGIFEVAGEYIDNVRLGRAGAVVFPEWTTREKARICREFAVEYEVGGPIYEIARLQGRVEECFAELAELGFAAVEISENIFTLDAAELRTDIQRARAEGLAAYFEYGRKYPDTEPFQIESAVRAIEGALEAGAQKVVIERAEIDLLIDEPEPLLELADRVGVGNLVFEAGPRKPEYVARLLGLFGEDVNLGNLSLLKGALDGVVIVENARRGLDRSTSYAFVESGADADRFTLRAQANDRPERV